MSYTALYRRWRPDTFEAVVGQEHIVKTLTNQIKAGRISHAYLFSGTRGTGKTSTAKIFAKAVNCENPLDGNPCNHCNFCENQNRNQSMNMIEIDAASNNGVDNIRELREDVRYTPTEGKYKVYIIDEVHMLSQGAFNALLKTLEEPPSHVIFILATTEPHKIPATILSRCQRYDFKRISARDIAKTLMDYMQEEGISAQENAIKYIAKVADGSMRDALSILDQCIAFYLGEEINLEKVLEVLGAVDTSVFTKIVDALEAKDVKICMEEIEKIYVQGRDFSQFIAGLMDYLRNLLFMKALGDEDILPELSEENRKIIKDQSLRVQKDAIINYIRVFSDLGNRMKLSSQKRVLLEIELIRLCQELVTPENKDLIKRVQSLEKLVQDGSFSQKIETKNGSSQEPEKKAVKKTLLKEAIPADIRNAIGRFSEIIQKMDGVDMAMLKKVTPAYMEDEFLYLICEDEIQKKRLSLEVVSNKIAQELSKLHNRTFQLRIITAAEYDHFALSTRDTSSGTKEAKEIFEEIKSKINFDVKEI